MTKRYCSQIEPLDVLSSEFKPLGGQFLGTMERKKQTDGGILLANEDTTWWVDVVSVGPDCGFDTGDRVLVNEFRGSNIDLADGQFTVFDRKECLAVLEEA
jgi:co-chaperonin GroES (HSP10)